MSGPNQETVPETPDAPWLLNNGGTTVPSDDMSVDLVAPMAPHASNGVTRDSLESTTGQSDLLPSMAPDPVAQAHQEIFNSAACALPPSLLAQQIAYNFPAARPVSTPVPISPPSTDATPQTTPAPRKQYRKTPLSELSAQEKEARQRLLASCNHDREVFLNFLKEPNHGGLAHERVVVLQRVFRHYSMSSFPASASGIEANKKARREGLAEIAHLKAQKASGLQQGIDGLNEIHGGESKEVSAPENTRVDAPENIEEGEGNAESEDTGTATGSQEHSSDGVTLSYSLNGKDCTKEQLDDGTSRYPRNAPPQQPEIAAPLPITEYLQDHQPTVPQQYTQQMQSQQIPSQQVQSQQMQGQFPWSEPYQGLYFQGYPPWH